MTPEFKATTKTKLQEWKGKGVSAVDALRDTEILCGKSNEEFAIDGRPLVEEVYGGTFYDLRGGGGVGFTPAEGTEGSEPQPNQTRGISVEKQAPVDAGRQQIGEVTDEDDADDEEEQEEEETPPTKAAASRSSQAPAKKKPGRH